ncbi:uncharacterized protein LOC130713480 [Lotus japonicus]|uniref:uncharacterized protein LOC130713480 n=1 Tax=Lotus japonicus TaxID=34305 RepID=UPI00258AB870|nr:uncharacterized protein LOC130713480 [Lotus japonicus]
MDQLPASNLPSKLGIKANPSIKKRLSSPRELISHYESQGMETEEASLKVIEDLQKALFGVIFSGRGKKDKLLTDSSTKMDAVNNRLNILDMKLDSKPVYAFN